MVLSSPDEVATITEVAAPGAALSPADIADIVAFLDTLTDPTFPAGRLGIPAAVPSGLSIPNP